MTQCIFCRIVKGELPAQKVYEDEDCLAFWDRYPKAPVHLLVIPKKHIDSLAHLEEADLERMGKLTLLLKQLAITHQLHNGFKITVNTGEGGGQEVFHLHYHLTGRPVENAIEL